MPFTVYILQDSRGRFYKGVTANLSLRVKGHKGGNTRSTRNMTGLNVAYKEEYATFAEARRRELYLKSAAGRRFLKKKLGP